jgi:hypothetical protein
MSQDAPEASTSRELSRSEIVDSQQETILEGSQEQNRGNRGRKRGRKRARR